MPDDLRWSSGNNNRSKVHKKGDSLNHPETITPPPSPVYGKIVFHETSSCCQKGWGPTLYCFLPTPSAALLPSGTFFPGVARSVALRAPGSALESVSLLPEAFFGGLGLAASKWVPALASFNAHSSLLA